MLLEQSCAVHGRLCPRQVLGVRIGLAGAEQLGLQIPRSDKRLLVIVECDGCFVSGVQAATGCSINHRTMRLEDSGKAAAAFVDVESGRAFRLAPRPDVRRRAWEYAPDAPDSYQAQMLGYQLMPANLLFSTQAVELAISIAAIVGRPGVRVNCSRCGEEIMNDRQVETPDGLLCRACAGESYYRAELPGIVQRTAP